MTRDEMTAYHRERRAKKLAEAPDPETNPVRQWRKANDLSLAAVGRLLDVAETTVWYWEHGLVKTPEWAQEIISEGMSDYMRRKHQTLTAQRRQRFISSPIRQWRKRHQINQAETAKLLGVSRGTLRSWECGDRTMPDWVPGKLAELKGERHDDKDEAPDR